MLCRLSATGCTTSPRRCEYHELADRVGWGGPVRGRRWWPPYGLGIVAVRDFDPPIIVNCRDRVTPVRKLVDWLERAGHEHIVLLDNASTYEPLLGYLDRSPHTVVRFDVNYGSRALWHYKTVSFTTGWFVYTDSDVLPINACPFDAVDRLLEAAEAWQRPKAALGLYTDDLADAHRVVEWEDRLLYPLLEDPWKGVIGHLANGTTVYDSLADTTFALYRPGTEFRLEALRLGDSYQLRHEDWYSEGFALSAEDEFYLAHAEGVRDDFAGSSWKDVAYAD